MKQIVMKSKTLTLALCIICLIFGGCSMSTSPADLPVVPVTFTPVQPETWVLPNGLTVMYQKDAELPLVQGKLYIRGGALWEPARDLGVVEAMGTQLRQGGAGSLSAEQLDSKLEELSASIGSDVGGELGSVAFNCLAQDVSTIFPIFSDVVFRPRFESSRLELWKGQMLEAIRRRSDDPGTISSIAFSQLVYGPTQPGRILTSQEISRLSPELLRAKHASFVFPDEAILTISGQIERAEAETLVQRYFSDWKPRGYKLPAPELVNYHAKPAIYFVPSSFAQSTILMGHLGVPRLTEDYVAIDGFNEVFGGGGFGSRLTRRIRSELGLAYGVYGSVLAAPTRGRNLISLQTKAESTATALDESLKVLQQMQREDISNEELDELKRAISNSFVFRFDTLDQSLGRAALLKLLNYPKDFDSGYLGRLADVSAVDIGKVAKSRWDISSFVVVVVGNEKAYSSIVDLLKTEPSELKGIGVQRVSFDEKLEF